MKTTDDDKDELLKKILIAIPVYNEDEYLNIVIERVREFACNILIIDDGSTDKTPELLGLHKNISVIRHKINSGYGRSLIDALEHARLNCYDWIITMDCDLQHEPETLPYFYESIKKNRYDIISGSRYLMPLETSGLCPPKSRAAINKKITEILNQSIGLKITDSFCGFKAYRVEFIKQMNLNIDGYAFPLQVWVQTARLGGRLNEIPVKMIYSDTFRSFGESLDDPERRFLYYMDTLNRELIRNGYQRVDNIESSFRKGHSTHIS